MISRAEKTYFIDLTGFVVVHIYHIVAMNVSYAYYPGRFFFFFQISHFELESVSQTSFL